MDKNKNTREAMPLGILVRFWEERLGKDDPLNPLNPLGEIIQDTIFHLKTLRKLPKDKPPLLSDEKIADLLLNYEMVNANRKVSNLEFVRFIAQAQREADIKHYEY